MDRIAAFALILVFLVPASIQASDGEDADTLLSKEVLKTLLWMHYAKEEPVMAPLDNLFFGDVNGDERNDAVLTYQRTNVSGLDTEMIQRIVVFIYDYDERDFVIRYDAEIGSTDSRILKPIGIEGGLVKFAVISPCSPLKIGDCDPPEITETQYHWRSDALVEL